MNNNQTYQHSYEVQEIVGKAPSWMVRWGISALFCTAGVLLLLSLYIKYGEMARYPISILSDDLPQYIVKGAGSRVTLLRPGGKVKAHDTIAVAEGGAVITAAFSGFLVPFDGAGRSADTLAMIIPPKSSYSFSGAIPSGLINAAVHPAAVSLVVQNANQPAVTLHGNLTAIYPAIDGNCVFRGELDQRSNGLLANENAFTSACRGELEVRLAEKSLFQLFVKKTFGF